MKSDRFQMKIDLTICEGKSLPNIELGAIGVVCKCYIKGKKVVKTAIINDDFVNPFWNQSFTFHYKNTCSLLVIEIYHEFNDKSKKLAYLEIDLNSFQIDEQINTWIPLIPVDGRSRVGSINIEACIKEDEGEYEEDAEEEKLENTEQEKQIDQDSRIYIEENTDTQFGYDNPLTSETAEILSAVSAPKDSFQETLEVGKKILEHKEELVGVRVRFDLPKNYVSHRLNRDGKFVEDQSYNMNYLSSAIQFLSDRIEKYKEIPCLNESREKISEKIKSIKDLSNEELDQEIRKIKEKMEENSRKNC